MCGAPLTAAAVINLVVPKADVATLCSELLGWYSQEPLPSNKLDAISKYPKQVQSVAGSPLCHVSVSRWVAAAKVREDSAERKERCGKLTGDVAAKTVEMLNAYAEGKFTPVFKVSPETAACMGCHVGKDSQLVNTYGKMACVPCHGDPHKK